VKKLQTNYFRGGYKLKRTGYCPPLNLTSDIVKRSDQDTDESSLSSIDISCGSSDYELEYLNDTTKGLLPYQFEPVDPEKNHDPHALEDSDCMAMCEDRLIPHTGK
jgi:hypothetical protein